MQQTVGYLPYFEFKERAIMPKGMDIATYQYPFINGTGTKLFKADNMDFIILRAGNQSQNANTKIPDTNFTTANVNALRAKGIKIGTYYYTRHINTKNIYAGGYTDANLQTEATVEANNYADILESVFGAGNCGDILPVCDFEDNRLDYSTNVLTPHQAYVWLKAFKDQMVVRFPQLASRGGVMLYTAYYYVDGGCGGNIQHTNGTKISVDIPKLWFASNSPDAGYHASLAYPNYNFTVFAGYTKYLIWQYSSDRNRMGSFYGLATTGNDMDFVDTVNNNYEDMLVYPETKPKGLALLDGKADKHHSHNGEYLPIQGGYLEGATRILTPNGFIFKQEQNKSWKMGRMSTSVATDHSAGDIALIPSSDYSDPSVPVEGETWDTSKAIIFKSDGNISVGGANVVTTATQTAFNTASDYTVSGKWSLSGGYISRGRVMVTEGTGTDKYYIAGRFTTNGTYQRAYMELFYFATGNYVHTGKIKAYLSVTTDFKTVSAGSFVQAFCDNNTIKFQAGDVVLVKKEGASSYIWDIYIKIYGYGAGYGNVPFYMNNGGATFTFVPDNGANLAALPAVNDVQNIGGTNYTVKEVVNATVSTYTAT